MEEYTTISLKNKDIFALCGIMHSLMCFVLDIVDHRGGTTDEIKEAVCHLCNAVIDADTRPDDSEYMEGVYG